MKPITKKSKTGKLDLKKRSISILNKNSLSQIVAGNQDINTEPTQNTVSYLAGNDGDCNTNVPTVNILNTI